jgi:hypothetical protein
VINADTIAQGLLNATCDSLDVVFVVEGVQR